MQLAFKYRQNSIHCTLLSLLYYSEKRRTARLCAIWRPTTDELL